jgi:hypothetical protein
MINHTEGTWSLEYDVHGTVNIYRTDATGIYRLPVTGLDEIEDLRELLGRAEDALTPGWMMTALPSLDIDLSNEDPDDRGRS